MATEIKSDVGVYLVSGGCRYRIGGSCTHTTATLVRIASTLGGSGSGALRALGCSAVSAQYLSTTISQEGSFKRPLTHEKLGSERRACAGRSRSPKHLVASSRIK